jgi:hypothetical protein
MSALAKTDEMHCSKERRYSIASSAVSAATNRVVNVAKLSEHDLAKSIWALAGAS